MLPSKFTVTGHRRSRAVVDQIFVACVSGGPTFFVNLIMPCHSHLVSLSQEEKEESDDDLGFSLFD